MRISCWFKNAVLSHLTQKETYQWILLASINTFGYVDFLFCLSSHPSVWPWQMLKSHRCAALLLWEPAVANRTWIPSASRLFQPGGAKNLCIEDTSGFKSRVESLFHKGTSQHQNFRKASIQTGVPVEQPELPLITPLSPQAAGDSSAIGFQQAPKTQEDTGMARSCPNHNNILPLRLWVRGFRSTNKMMWGLNRCNTSLL